MKTFVFGHTSLGLPIMGYSFGPTPSQVLILGGVHGNEIEGVTLSFGLIEKFLRSFPFQIGVTVVPAFNLDGVLAKTRVNARGVDLNRNLPTKDWNPKAFNERYPPGPYANSEIENHALVDYMKTTPLRFILSLHSFHPMILVNGDCQKEAELMSRFTGYEVKKDVGYPTPGSLGTYGGHDFKIPTITYEIERGQKLDEVLKIHIPPVIELIKYLEGKKK
ncbi:MAG: M14 family zinc carboxypeptidase [Bdellovibrionales bacterium]